MTDILPILPKNKLNCRLAFIDGIPMGADVPMPLPLSTPIYNYKGEGAGPGNRIFSIYEDTLSEIGLAPEDVLFYTVFPEINPVKTHSGWFFDHVAKENELSKMMFCKPRLADTHMIPIFKSIPKSKYGYIRADTRHLSDVDRFVTELSKYPNLELIICSDYLSYWLLTGYKSPTKHYGITTIATSLAAVYGKKVILWPRSDIIFGLTSDVWRFIKYELKL